MRRKRRDEPRGWSKHQAPLMSLVERCRSVKFPMCLFLGFRVFLTMYLVLRVPLVGHFLH